MPSAAPEAFCEMAASVPTSHFAGHSVVSVAQGFAVTDSRKLLARFPSNAVDVMLVISALRRSIRMNIMRWQVRRKKRGQAPSMNKGQTRAALENKHPLFPFLYGCSHQMKVVLMLGCQKRRQGKQQRTTKNRLTWFPVLVAWLCCLNHPSRTSWFGFGVAWQLGFLNRFRQQGRVQVTRLQDKYAEQILYKSDA